MSDLAERIGVSVRTLHHYDDIGLLRPTHLTPAGHRRYSPDDVLRLDQIRSLQETGLSLESIRRGFDHPRLLRQLMEDRLRVAREELAEQQRRVEALATTVDWVRSDGSLRDSDIVRALQHVDIYHRYFTASQRQQIERTCREAGDVGYVRGRAAWREVLTDIDREMKRGSEPSAPRVLEGVGKLRRLVSDFTSDDPRLQRALMKLYLGEPRFRERRRVGTRLYHFLRSAHRHFCVDGRSPGPRTTDRA